MKYVILIHANPDPWGHPTLRYTAEGRVLPPERHEEMDRQFEALMEEISASGGFVTAEALADPARPGRSVTLPIMPVQRIFFAQGDDPATILSRGCLGCSTHPRQPLPGGSI